MKFIEYIFSITNQITGKSKHKVITILGFKIKLKIKQSPCEIKLMNVSANIDTVNQKMDKIIRKLSMVDDIWHLDNVKIFVPRYPNDIIQNTIVDKCKFYEQEMLEELDKYIPNNAIILDLGANIGNHSLYWALKSPKNIKTIYSFEPVKEIYDILEKNINLNHANDKIKIYNYGLSDSNCFAEIDHFENYNIGGTSLVENNGDIQLKCLDDIDFDDKNIDFVKIDVENFETKLLKGGKNTLLKNKPLIYIESWPKYYDEMHEYITALGYELVIKYPAHNYLYQHTDRKFIG